LVQLRQDNLKLDINAKEKTMNSFFSFIGSIVTFLVAGVGIVKFIESDFGFYSIVAMGCTYVVWVIWYAFIDKPKDK
jgi:hypothetical protein